MALWRRCQYGRICRCVHSMNVLVIQLTLYLHFWALYKGNTVQYHLYLHCYASRSKYITKAINEITKINSSLSLVFITYEGGFPFLSLKEKIGKKVDAKC